VNSLLDQEDATDSASLVPDQSSVATRLSLRNSLD
jgi:hypothetical protein